ncbi:MAG: SDR family oxidoreductase [Candidatus Hydrogenedentota bacterium]
MKNFLVLGATGYVGGRLVPRLLDKGYTVRCLVRNPAKAEGRRWSGAEIRRGNVLDKESLLAAMEGVDLVYYMVHLMRDSASDLLMMEKQAARNTREAAEAAGVKRIVYLGALGRDTDARSTHLKSRHATGDILADGTVPVTELCAGVIIGAGSASFEVIQHLVNKLPVMVTPRWVYKETQPLGVEDALQYLLEAAENPETAARSFDIGCPEVVTYKELMLAVARELNLKRFMIPVPVLTPRLSSYWLNLVTPIDVSLGRSIIESLSSKTVCADTSALDVFSVRPQSYYEVVKEALVPLTGQGYVETHWTGASGNSEEFFGETTNVKADSREVEINASPAAVFAVIKSIGGKNGWYFADRLWKVRGFIDKRLGGVGLGRGRRDPHEVLKGEAIDFFRVEDIRENERLLLKAEMKTGGKAWLEFRVMERDQGRSLLRQTAYYYPHGVLGYMYWYGVYPFHAYVFNGMVKAIARKSEEPRP